MNGVARRVALQQSTVCGHDSPFTLAALKRF